VHRFLRYRAEKQTDTNAGEIPTPATAVGLGNKPKVVLMKIQTYPVTWLKEYSTGQKNGVNAFSYKVSAESEPICMKSGAL